MNIESKPHLIQFNKNMLNLTKAVAGHFPNVVPSPAAISALQQQTKLIAQTGLGHSQIALTQGLQHVMKTLAIPHLPPNSLLLATEIGSSFKAFQTQLALVMARVGQPHCVLAPLEYPLVSTGG